MTQEYRYCWLKMVEITESVPVRDGTTPTGLAAWAESGNALQTFVGYPPYQASGDFSKLPTPAPNAFPPLAIVFSGCKPCPTPSPRVRYAATDLEPIEAMTPPPAPLEGWQIEGAPLAGAIAGEGPKVFFACRPVAGSRADAVAWLATAEGEEWLQDSTTCVLMSYFRPA